MNYIFVNGEWALDYFLLRSHNLYSPKDAKVPQSIALIIQSQALIQWLWMEVCPLNIMRLPLVILKTNQCFSRPQTQLTDINYPVVTEIPGEFLVDPCAAQTSLTTDSVPIYSEISNLETPIILSTINCDDVEIVPPPPIPTCDSDLHFLPNEDQLVDQPQSLFEMPDLTSQPRKWSIASGDKPVDPKLMAGEMIDVVRSATGLSHRKCQMAAQVVLGYIQVRKLCTFCN